MGAAIGLHTAAIFGIMVPSLLGLGGLLGDFLTNFALITLAHAALRDFSGNHGGLASCGMAA